MSNKINLTKHDYKTSDNREVKLFSFLDGNWYGVVRSKDSKEWFETRWDESGINQKNFNLNLYRRNGFEIIKFITEYKTVVYFGIELEVPKSIEYIATNYNGDVVGFVERPKIDNTYNQFVSSELIYIGTVKYIWDWKDSLLKV